MLIINFELNGESSEKKKEKPDAKCIIIGRGALHTKIIGTWLLTKYGKG